MNTSKRFIVLGIVLALVVVAAAVVAGSPANAKYRDGSWVGLVKDPARGDTVIEVVVKDGKIADVNIVMPTEEYIKGEKYAPALEAYTNIPKEIIARQSADVDVVSKATGSSKKYMEAVKKALAIAEPKGQLPKGAKWHDGSYVGFVKDPEHGDTVVEVVIKGGKMAEVNIISPTAKYMSEYKYEPGKEAYKEMPGRFIKAQSADVDIYTKATGSSKKYIEAVKLALKQAQ